MFWYKWHIFFMPYEIWRLDVRFLAPVIIMAVNTSNPFKAIRQLIEETNKDLSILQEGVEKEITNEPLITADQEDGYEAILIEDEGVVPEDQPNDKMTVADVEDQDSDRADNEKQAQTNERENNNSAGVSVITDGAIGEEHNFSQNGGEVPNSVTQNGDAIVEAAGDIVLTDTEIRDNVILFADTLLKYLKKYKASPKRKENFEWEGNFDDLKAFVSLILKAEGDWSGSEKKSTGKLIFKEKHGKFCLNWWKSKHTLLFQGKPEDITKYEDLLDKRMYGEDVSSKKKHGGTKPRPKAKSTKSVIIEATHSSADNTVDFVEAEEEDTEETEFTHNHTQAERSNKKANKSKQKGDSKDFEKIWTAINDLRTTVENLASAKIQKSLCSTFPEFKNDDIEINHQVQNGKTRKGNIGRITNYFKRITKQEAESVISADQVKRIAGIRKRNMELEDKVKSLRKQLNKLSNENQELKQDLDKYRQEDEREHVSQGVDWLRQRKPQSWKKSKDNKENQTV